MSYAPLICCVCGGPAKTKDPRGPRVTCSRRCTGKLVTHKRGPRPRPEGEWTIVGDGTATRDLKKGRTLIVDVDDLPLVRDLPWWGHDRYCTSYARTMVDKKWIYCHHFIVPLPVPPLEVDHWNGNGLDCRRANLRVVTPAQNCQNRRNWRRSKSGFIGVGIKGGRWTAYVGNRWIGTFDDPIEAAKARDVGAIEDYGPDALLNFPANEVGAAS